MPTLFTQLIERKLPAHIFAEDAHHVALLDLYPRVEAHTLVIPKKEVASLFSLSDSDTAKLFQFVKKIGLHLAKHIPCERVALSVVGLEVPHVHVHLLPIHSEKELLGAKVCERAPESALKALCERLYIPTTS